MAFQLTSSVSSTAKSAKQLKVLEAVFEVTLASRSCLELAMMFEHCEDVGEIGPLQTAQRSARTRGG